LSAADIGVAGGGHDHALLLHQLGEPELVLWRHAAEYVELRQSPDDLHV